MHHQRGWQPSAQHLEITDIGQTLPFALIRPLDRCGQGGEDDGRVFRVLEHKLVEDEVLGAAGEVIEGEGKGGGCSQAGGW